MLGWKSPGRGGRGAGHPHPICISTRPLARRPLHPGSRLHGCLDSWEALSMTTHYRHAEEGKQVKTTDHGAPGPVPGQHTTEAPRHMPDMQKNMLNRTPALFLSPQIRQHAMFPPLKDLWRLSPSSRTKLGLRSAGGRRALTHTLPGTQVRLA